jgi:hypothetical protein
MGRREVTINCWRDKVLINFTTYDEFVEEYKNYHYHECLVCGDVRELTINDLDVSIENRRMHFKDFLILTCINCGSSCLPQHSKQMIDGWYKIMVKEGHFEGIQTYNGYKKKFRYCIDQDFKYDHRDYYNIPGLCFDEEHSEEGFLTPVYFTKKVLLYFMQDPDYKMDLFSESYGHISFKDEWSTPFGINRNGLVIFWLGDLSYIDSTSLSIMKPHNIESDHQIIDSEYYAAQLGCVWSEPNKEVRVCYKKKELFDQINIRFNIDLSHLNDEIKDHMRDFRKPVLITKTSIEPAVNMLHKVLIEGVNINSFRTLYLELYPKPQKGYKEWKSIKFYQALLERVISENDDIYEIIAPLYLLNDLRQYYDHLLSKEKREHIENNVIKSLGIESFNDIDMVYEGLINRLNILFQYLVVGYSEE